MSGVATVEQQNTVPEQQATVPEQQTALPRHIASKKAQPPRYNFRVATYFDATQIGNIKILQQKSGNSETGVMRTAIDLLSYLNGLPVETDPSIYLHHFLVQQNGGPTNGQR
jgi:hypothetical protein